MRRVSAGRSPRRGAGAVAVAGLLTASLAAPAFADEPQTDQLWINPPYRQALPLGADGGGPQTRPLDIGLYHDNGNFTITDGKVTVDVSGLAGVAEVTWPDNCAPSGTTAVCDVPVVPVIGPDYTAQIRLMVRAADGAAAGAEGRITYEATATGGPSGTLVAPHHSFDTTLTVASGPDLAITDVAPIRHAEPGDEKTLPFELANHGDATAHGITVTMRASYGLEELTRYDACTYSRTSGDDYAPMTRAECFFDRELAPGDTFELPEPLKVTLTRHALEERLDIIVDPGDGAEDLRGEDNYLALLIGADSTADFSVTGDAVSGEAGQTVRARLTFRNNGPGWLGDSVSGDPVAKVRLIVPEGTTVTGVPDGCSPRSLDGTYLPRQTGAPRYDCALRFWVLEDTERSYDFSLRIDSVIPGATGAVSIHPAFGDFTHDPDDSNNTAVLTVN
ncbi:hypothetical protein [Streptomyces tagetis]|uniref:CARDB domain-containing protein n=1 Tax=Streptomyces tagetis TaxID=2820809 RepID=A0A941B6K6_9ACTN|nr:hypothetical protein [Streptomyces sp. RG38]MBQ0826483.1 hypothetical protein [Streptomyces sp. RG38]